MSFVQRRRFLWILFLAGLTLLAIAANAETLSQLGFEELNQGAKANRFACQDGPRDVSNHAGWLSYTVYAEALNRAVDPSRFDNAIVSLCRNTVSDPESPLKNGLSAQFLVFPSIANGIRTLVLKSEPTAAEDQARPERGQENWSAAVARLLLRDPQSFMQCCAARG